MRPRPLALAAAIALLPLCAASLSVTAAQAATPNASAPRVALPNTVTPAVAHSQKQGDVPAAQQLSVAVSLKLRNTADLDKFLADVANPASANYGHYLTPAEFTARYAPTQADVDHVVAFLKSQGLTASVSANRQVIDAKGSNAQIAQAFGTHESAYYDASDAKQFFANDNAASLPADVAAIVDGVSGLNNKTVRTPELAKPNTSHPLATPSGYGPSQYDGAYNLNKVGADGTGVKVALWEFDGYTASNLSTYDKQYGLTGPAPTTVPVDGQSYDSAPGDGQGEVELDSEIISGVAPKATQLVYEAPNSDQGEIDMAAKIVADDQVSVISISWGGCEPDTTQSSMTAVDTSFKQAAAEGISVYSASGDDGSRDCTRSTSGASVKSVDFPGSDTYVTSVGGTNLQVSGTSYSSESAWSTAGGGVSTVFAKPSWQTGTGVSGTMRTVPDVSSNADPNSGFAIYTQGTSGPAWQQYGGTSAAAPLWSGFTALFNQKAAAAGKANLGQANPALYAVANSSSYGTSFHDVKTGANQDFKAGTGYDQVTGWGTPVADALTTALLGGGGTTGGNTVTVTNPGTQSGTVGTAVSLQVKGADSASGQTLTYTATGLPAGLSISSTGLITGTPTAAGTSSVTVTAKDATGATGSATFGFTVATGSTGCTPAQLLGNAGFETGTAAPWTASTGVVDNSSSEAAHSGSWKAWLDGYGSTHTDTVSQSVTIPAGCKATFSFWLHVDTAETGTTAYDKLAVTANGTNLATYSNVNASTGYVQKSFDLSSYAGQTVTLKFTGTEDSSLQTSFVIDDTAVNVG
ncbi:protease pro-enzyme activation domain-containing protein [Kitasatospora sp. NBC_01287]|uniref:protease pro-enzyme activation domain-containing protein n=1 Tax=Kitasatospora sp. NBC_01287 TaxID=2903573 RepID=UPI0022577127|nr:protease pro-enzyme activation domain-containing protein [Kitasatospora sp. NBC_01287]MCX4747722.1 protease pro-enzyme activation domain-containing protein [Kitasatospora sp. NBC_01287]